MKFLMGFLFALVVCQPAWAVREVGNGGKGVVCRDSNGSIVGNVKVLDFYEAEVRQIPINLGSKDLSVAQKLELMLQRLEKQGDSRRVKEYRETISKFNDTQNHTRFLAHTQLRDTEDSWEITVPQGCKVEQVVIQQLPEFPEDRLFTVSKDLWDRMDNDHRAGLIMHEAAYREAVSYNHKDSKMVRYFVAYMAADKLTTFNTPKKYFSFLDKIKLFATTYRGININVPPEFNEKEQVTRATLNFAEIPVNGSKVKALNTNEDFYPELGLPKHFKAAEDSQVTLLGQPVIVRADGDVGLTEKGHFEYAQLNPKSVFKYGEQIYNISLISVKDNKLLLVFPKPSNFKWNGQDLKIGGLTSNINGALTHFYQHPRGEILEMKFQIQNQWVNVEAFASDGKIEGLGDPSRGYVYAIMLHSNGNLKIGSIKSPLHLVTPNYDLNILPGYAEFYEDQGVKAVRGNGQVMYRGKRIQVSSSPDDYFRYSDLTVTTDGRLLSGFSEKEIKIPLQDKDLNFCGRFSLFENGKLKYGKACKGYFSQNTNVQLKVGDVLVTFDLSQGIFSYDGEKIKAGALAEAATLKDDKGNLVTYSSGKDLSFNEKGEVLSNPPLFGDITN